MTIDIYALKVSQAKKEGIQILQKPQIPFTYFRVEGDDVHGRMQIAWCIVCGPLHFEPLISTHSTQFYIINMNKYFIQWRHLCMSYVQK